MTIAHGQQPDFLAPVARTTESSNPEQKNSALRTEAPNTVLDAILGGVNSVDALDEARQTKTLAPSIDAVLGNEAGLRVTTDTGNLINKTHSVRGVASQQRTPIVTDTRIRGERVGQVLAAGSFWAPVRMDLDTMMSKLDSRLIG